MSFYGALIIYIVIWWITFFCVLPWGIKTQNEIEDEDEIEDGTDLGSPIRTGLKIKFLWTSVIALLFWIMILYVSQNNLITLEQFSVFNHQKN